VVERWRNGGKTAWFKSQHSNTPLLQYLGTHRVTFLIGPDGRIKKIWPQVKPDAHAEEVLAVLENLTGA